MRPPGKGMRSLGTKAKTGLEKFTAAPLRKRIRQREGKGGARLPETKEVPCYSWQEEEEVNLRPRAIGERGSLTWNAKKKKRGTLGQEDAGNKQSSSRETTEKKSGGRIVSASMATRSRKGGPERAEIE